MNVTPDLILKYYFNQNNGVLKQVDFVEQIIEVLCLLSYTN